MFNLISMGWAVVKAARLEAKQKRSNSDYPPSLDNNVPIVESEK